MGYRYIISIHIHGYEKDRKDRVERIDRSGGKDRNKRVYRIDKQLPWRQGI